LTFNKKYGLRLGMTPKQALIRAIGKAGSQVKLAELIGTAQQNISYDLNVGRSSHNLVLRIEKATGVPKEQLRPDLYPVD